ncbi:MAG TPA: hypothetical protein VFP65_29375 [Anaeromyxobacteraceae bacterium]|nr:hypothetical protein [Anaeromyxobacteraceae bacterium]
MNKRHAALAVAVLVSLAARAEAQAGAVNPGFGASLRLAYGLPAGQTTGATGDDLSRVFSGSLPIQLDLGYRITPNASVAIYGQYGFGFTASDLDRICAAVATTAGTTVDCSGHDVRLGVEGFWHFQPGQHFDPWVGLGVGYEWMTVSASANGVSADVSAHGWEFLNLQLGLDWLVAPSFGIGPFLQVSFGQYGTQEASAPGQSQSQDITNKGVHEWVQFGLRGTFNL